MTQPDDEDQISRPPPPKPQGWRSSLDLSQEYVGRSTNITRVMEHVRNNLIQDVTTTVKCPEGEAVRLVDDFLIGRRKPARGPSAIAASPEVVRLLGLTARREAAPPKPAEWRSARELSYRYSGGSELLNRELLRLRGDLIQDLEASEFPGSDMAAEIVDAYLIGVKKPVRGAEALAASPLAVRIAEDVGRLVLRGHRR